ncbi:hypothetical protein QL919_11505 [Psychrobacter sp. APC 3426]|uniref:hypothetical protein n=1 Tax=Psychrobacter sp. APC 3426 TaxID=3035177 RepID=UPI0025B4C9DF|nr:hypothetical protein [Psychrobacter sp. APC 3426]MDN3399350.1 hypothetical protein [Psychrobacter sp. APC 3426]
MKFSCALETSSERIRLVNVISPLIKAGYQLISQKQEPSENGGNIIHVVAKTQGTKTQADLIDDLSSIEGCTLFKLEIDEETVSSPSTPVKKALDEKSVLAAIGAQYPDIVDVVRQYEDGLPDEMRIRALHELGRKVGGGIYQRDYALGSPLKMSAAISRELVPALKAFTKVKASDHSITLIKCPFCKTSHSHHLGCNFVVGYIEGFLTSNPIVGRVRVEETKCGAGSTNICEFTIW